MFKHIGGNFAPPVDDKKLKKYAALADAAGGPVGDSMKALVAMLKTFRETPASKAKASPHPAGRGTITPLEPEEVKRIDAVVPWKHELDAYAALFDTIPADGKKELRDAAFHLLWFGYELFADREPHTNDLL